MLLDKPTKADIEEWKRIYNQNKDSIRPNKKTGIEIIEFLQNRYPAKEIEDGKLQNIVRGNIVSNEFSEKKLKGRTPIIKTFLIENIGNGANLYLEQDDVFKGIPIIVGVELTTSYIYTEGSSILYDELIAFTGLDEYDISNYFLVAQYIECKDIYK